MALKATTKACERCGGLFVPTGNQQKYCPACRAAMNDLSESTFQPVTVSVTPEQIAEEVADQVNVEPAQSAQREPVSVILDTLEAWLGVQLIPEEDLTPYQVTAGDEILFNGYAWKMRRT